MAEYNNKLHPSNYGKMQLFTISVQMDSAYQTLPSKFI